MNLVDKRLDKATAPRLLWVIGGGFAASLTCPLFGASLTKARTPFEVSDVPLADIGHSSHDVPLTPKS
jgi:hypothetical protein